MTKIKLERTSNRSLWVTIIDFVKEEEIFIVLKSHVLIVQVGLISQEKFFSKYDSTEVIYSLYKKKTSHSTLIGTSLVCSLWAVSIPKSLVESGIAYNYNCDRTLPSCSQENLWSLIQIKFQLQKRMSYHSF